MPAKSQAQYRLMQAAAHGGVKGVPKSVGKEFVKATGSPKGLPQHVKKSGRGK